MRVNVERTCNIEIELDESEARILMAIVQNKGMNEPAVVSGFCEELFNNLTDKLNPIRDPNL